MKREIYEYIETRNIARNLLMSSFDDNTLDMKLCDILDKQEVKRICNHY
jgi:hypothetical protein